MDKLEETIWLLVLSLGYILATSPDLDCSSESEMLKLQKQCFTEKGIDIALPTYSKDDSKNNHKKGYMEAVIAQKAHLLCARQFDYWSILIAMSIMFTKTTQQAEFQAALECAMTHTRSCMPVAYQGYVPEPRKMAQFVSTLCSNNVVFECAKRKASNLYDCGTRKGKEAFSTGGMQHTMENIMCKAFQFNAECQVTELRECGCDTVRAYENVSRDLLYPPSCPPLPERPRVQCQPTNQFLFLENAGCGVWEHFVLVLCISCVCALFELLV